MAKVRANAKPEPKPELEVVFSEVAKDEVPQAAQKFAEDLDNLGPNKFDECTVVAVSEGIPPDDKATTIRR